MHTVPLPVKPLLHVHVKDPAELLHVALASQGFPTHSSTSFEEIA